ncbi:hypothetical protein PC9H_011045 [Pleurotus ostreatus]|uniref:DUF4203 domain-containing protein n=2 Tax=Pleurotus TaxID=5320 RepID=A0A8H6ZNL4_PLEOS|nr:uncharacterized protein PC9H_011045 [Pleurotus ostreatus]KAF7422881.1 hypothetical protein PC9H_011045 [Pleurotus ostreatus]KAG9227270.1 hypothetical protein CCMSSC00406_0004191 [Pleurotus cornucopiae]KAJ8691153.1 hypothetical protein PTI98_010750 [Pleurotus ostreatus]
MSSESYNLQYLLPNTPFLLAYSLPLLLVSLILTFTGSFLTLDRTRSFPQKYQPIPGSFGTQNSRKQLWILEGGVGGLAIGFLFGVQLSTLLALLIPSVTSSSRLGNGSFLAIWIISSVLTTLLAGRWRYCAFAFIGLSGGSMLATGLSIIIHPNLVTRQIFVGILTPFMLISSLLPLPRHRRITLRFCAATAGSFGLTLSTALLAHIPAWANCWERLWVHADIEWGTSHEKGLSAMFCLCIVIGVVVDWFLRRKFGECPDEKWDSYLADYASNLPNRADRAGSFQPLTTFWERTFGAKKEPEIIFPPTSGTPDLKSPQGFDVSVPSLHKHDDVLSLPKSPGFLRKARSQTRFSPGAKRREAVKFRPMGELSSDSEHEGDSFPRRPWLKHNSTTSTDATLVDAKQGGSKSRGFDPKGLDYDEELAKLQALGKARDIQEGSIPEYSDHEDEQPAKSTGASSATSHTAVAQLSPSASSHPAHTPLAPVPATPSLIMALDRVAIAQRQAFGGNVTSPTPKADGLPRASLPPSADHLPLEGRAVHTGRWQDFWREVDDKARQ